MSGKAAAAPQQAPGTRKRAVRQQRSHTSRPPEPKDVVTSAGQPLDIGLRRDMESRFGHDFSRVRIHNDRDAAALADLVGADAVTVGQDVFFAQGAFHPETAEGRRLLGHELLHTVQVPHASGPLRLGRHAGALSQPHDPIEQEAEERARGGGEALPAVREQVAQTASWLRFTRVTAEQRRSEQLDPATLVDRLVAGVLRSLRGDPTDASGRVRLQLGRLAPELQSAVLDTLEVRLPSSELRRVLDWVADAAPDNADSAQTPEPVTDDAERTETERDRDENAKRQENEHQQRLDEDASKERKDAATRPDGSAKETGAGRTPEGGKPGADNAGTQRPAEGNTEGQIGQRDGKGDQGKDTPPQQQAQPGPQQPPQPQTGQQPQPGQPAQSGAQPAEGGSQPGQQPLDAAAQGPQAAVTQPAAAEIVGAKEQQRKATQQQPAAGAKPQAVGRGAAEKPGPVRPERVDRIAEGRDSPLVRHGLLDRGDGREEPGEQELPVGLEPAADKEINTPQDEVQPAETVVASPELRPEDFLPQTDLDVSGVPTADQMTRPADGSPPSPAEVPSFPEPPATTAEQVQAQREQEPEADTEAPAAPAAPQGAAPVGEEAEDTTTQDSAAQDTATRDRVTQDGAQDTQTANDLQTGKSLQDEVGPDPETASPTAPEPASPDQTSARAEERPEPESPATLEASAVPAQPPGAAPAAAVREADAGPVGGFAGPAVAGPVGGAQPAGVGALAPAADLAGPAPEAAAGPVEAPGELGAPGPVAAEASLEPGGGECAGPQQPTTEGAKPEGGEGGCGAGEGAAGAQATQPPRPAPPDVSGQDPQSALATVGTLPPDQMVPALSSVDGSVDRTVSQRHAALQAAPPAVQRPSGAPQTLAGQPTEAPPAAANVARVERVGVDATTAEQQKAQGTEVTGSNPGSRAPAPGVANDSTNTVSDREVQNMQGAVDGVPTTDPALNTTVGDAPKVELSGESDPARTGKQAEKLKGTATQILGVGREDAAKPMGEDQIYPNVPNETLTGNVPGGGSGGGPAKGAGAAAANPGVAVVAQQERGPQIQASVGRGDGQMANEQAKQQQGEAQQRQQSQAEQDKAVADNAAQQAGERGQAAEQVKTEREQWRTEQDQKISEADTQATTEHDSKNKDIDTKRTDTDKDVGKRQENDNKEIQKNREQAEEKARKEKERKQEESSGWWGWVKSKVKAAFDWLVEQVTKIFDFFRSLVNGIIQKFKEFANWAIDQARKFVVDQINKLADALIAIGDVLLAAFPELRDKFRKKIEQWRDKAIAKVNEYADKLKAAVNKLLDALGAALSGLLNLLEQGLKAAINMVRDAVLAAINFAQQAIAVLGQFAALVADIAPDPGGWLKNLGTAASDGIQHYLWGAIKGAVKQWFNEKVESVLGLGNAIINVLIKGCMSMAEIGRMAWEAIIQALPMMIISLVVEKVVSMIVPAAGAILTIIQGLVAAWDTISKIIATFGKFFAFLKAVKGGGIAAACLFAGAVASGVVALLEFITNFLLQRLGSALKGVANKLKGIAQKIMKGLSKAGRGARKAAGGAVNRARQGLRTASQALRRPALAGRDGPGAVRRPTVAGRSNTRARPQRPQPLSRPTRRPGEQPSQHIPGEHPVTRPGQHEPGPQPAHQPAAPKPRPRRPTLSTAGRALTRVKNAVRSGLRQVRNATRVLGRKLRNSKLGRALTSGARKLRDAFKRQRDKLRDQFTKRQQQRKRQRDERRKNENSPESKAKRLELIIARIQPKITSLLRRGVYRYILGGILGAMRIWYRLTDLSSVGFPEFQITATLNPRGFVRDGIYYDFTGEEIDRLNRGGIRRLSSNAEAEHYGEAVLRPIFKALPNEQRKAIEEYTWWSYPYNKISRGGDADALLSDWSKSRGERAKLLDVFGGREPTLQDIRLATRRTDLNPKQRKLIDEILASPDPRKKRRDVLKSGGIRDRLERTFEGKFPTSKDVFARMDLMDKALRNPLPEGLEVQRTLKDVNFMKGIGGDARSLVGTKQAEPGYMSTSLGSTSAFDDVKRNPYRLHLDVPRGAPALWVGQLSKYSTQREVILPRGTEYHITKVLGPNADGTWDIYARVLLAKP